MKKALSKLAKRLDRTLDVAAANAAANIRGLITDNNPGTHSNPGHSIAQTTALPESYYQQFDHPAWTGGSSSNQAALHQQYQHQPNHSSLSAQQTTDYFFGYDYSEASAPNRSPVSDHNRHHIFPPLPSSHRPSDNIVDEIFSGVSAPQPSKTTGSYRSHPSSSTLQSENGTQNPERDALKRLEDAQLRLNGPKWEIDDFNWTCCEENHQLRTALSNPEFGPVFTAQNAARYDELGDVSLARVLTGLSRRISLSNSDKDLRHLQKQITQKNPDCQGLLSVHDIRTSDVPVFAVAIEYPFSTPQGFSQLYTVLRALANGGEVRLWLEVIANRHCSKGARQYRDFLLPFMLFPVITGDIEPKLPYGEGWPLIRFRLGLSCMGVLYADRNARMKNKWDPFGFGKMMEDHEKRASLSELDTVVRLNSRAVPGVHKLVGAGSSISEGLNLLARMLLDGSAFRAEIRAWRLRPIPAEGMDAWIPKSDILEKMKAQELWEIELKRLLDELSGVAMQHLRGDSMQAIALGTGNLMELYSPLGEVGRMRLIRAVKNKDGIVEGKPLVSVRGWDGICEFIADRMWGEALELDKWQRWYDCFFSSGFPTMVVAARARVENVELSGALLVERKGEDIRRGKVTKICMMSSVSFDLVAGNEPFYKPGQIVSMLLYHLDIELENVAVLPWKKTRLDFPDVKWDPSS